MKPTVAILMVVLAVGCEAPARSAGPAHVLILRHAEKPPDSAGDAGLNDAGKKRAARLHELFEGTEAFPKPDFLFAAAATKKSVRSIETAKPLGKALGLSVNAEFDGDDVGKLAEHLWKPKYAGKTVLIVWKHHAIPALAAKLGATDTPKDWKDDTFDRVWQLDFADGKATFRDRPQGLK